MRPIIDIYKGWYEKGIYTEKNIELFLNVKMITEEEYNYILGLE